MPKAKPLPPLELISQFLAYDVETGLFTWKKSKGRAKIGQIAGKIFQPNKNQFYCAIAFEGQRYYAHRLAYYFCTEIDPGSKQVDHIDGNGLNNACANLRLATCSQNQFNGKRRKGNTSGYKGVSRFRNKWTAGITVNRQRINLGVFPTPELAHMAYCKAAAELHGDFARTM